MAKEICFWQDKIFFEDGWFGYYDGKGNYSVISKECACKMVSDYQDYQAYQASQDMDRGGMDMDRAFAGRGFERVDGKYVYMGNDVERLPDGPVGEIGEILEIPEKVGIYHINRVHKLAFQGEKQIKKVILHEKIDHIGQMAFADCENLWAVQGLSEKITVMADAFANTRLFEGEHAEYLKNVLLKVKITNQVKFVVKSGTTSIAEKAFMNCKEITEIDLPESVEYIENVDNWLVRYKDDFAENLYMKKGTIGVADMSNFRKPLLKGVAFPEGLKYIGYCAFQKADIKSVKLPKTLELIKRSAFRGTKMKEITLPASVKYVDEWVFMDCEALDKIIVEGEKTQIIWPAITGHGNGTPTIIEAPKESSAHAYCEKYKKKYNLVFEERKPVVKKNIFTFRRKK